MTTTSTQAPPAYSPPRFGVIPPPVTFYVSDHKAKEFRGWGISHIMAGVGLIVSNIGADVAAAEITTYAVPGYWCGIFAIITGAFGVLSGKKRKKSFVTAFDVLSVFDAILMMACLVCSSWGIWYTNRLDPKNVGEYHIPASLAMNSLLIVVCSVEFLIAIVSSVVCSIVLNLPSKLTPAAAPKVKQVNKLAIAQVLMGIVMITFNYTGSVYSIEVSADTGSGYWCGFFIIISGLIGITGVRKKRKHFIITFSVLSLLAVVIAIGPTLCGGLGLWNTSRNDLGSENPPEYYATASYVVNSLLLISGLATFIVAILSTVVCSQALNVPSPSRQPFCYSNPMLYSSQEQDITPYYLQLPDPGQPPQPVDASFSEPPPPYESNT